MRVGLELEEDEEEELVMVDVILAESAGGWFPPIWLLLRLSFSSTGR